MWLFETADVALQSGIQVITHAESSHLEFGDAPKNSTSPNHLFDYTKGDEQ